MAERPNERLGKSLKEDKARMNSPRSRAVEGSDWNIIDMPSPGLDLPSPGLDPTVNTSSVDEPRPPEERSTSIDDAIPEGERLADVVLRQPLLLPPSSPASTDANASPGAFKQPSDSGAYANSDASAAAVAPRSNCNVLKATGAEGPAKPRTWSGALSHMTGLAWRSLGSLWRYARYQCVVIFHKAGGLGQRCAGGIRRSLASVRSAVHRQTVGVAEAEDEAYGKCKAASPVNGRRVPWAWIGAAVVVGLGTLVLVKGCENRTLRGQLKQSRMDVSHLVSNLRILQDGLRTVSPYPLLCYTAAVSPAAPPSAPPRRAASSILIEFL